MELLSFRNVVLFVLISITSSQILTNTFTIDDLPSGNQCGAQVGDKIFGGEVAALTDFPWLALIHYRKPRGRGAFLCGGSLIHENYVLTAAHCIRSPLNTRKRYVIDSVRLGEHDLRSTIDCQESECAGPVEDIPVAEIIVHESYDANAKTEEHDIALIRLERSASTTNYIRPVCLPIGDLRNKNYDGLALTVAGFGKTENASRSDVKMKVGVNGVNLEQCSNTYQREYSRTLGSKMLCAGGERDKDSCNGDSGGPLVADDKKQNHVYSYLVGVVSFGPSNCGNGIAGVYTRVDQYIDWIVDHMRK